MFLERGKKREKYITYDTVPLIGTGLVIFASSKSRTCFYFKNTAI